MVLTAIFDDSGNAKGKLAAEYCSQIKKLPSQNFEGETGELIGKLHDNFLPKHECSIRTEPEKKSGGMFDFLGS